LQIARDLLQPIKDKYPQISYADFWQLAGVVAVEAMGGPKVVFRPGRIDAASENDCAVEGRLPDATQGRDHLRWVFTEKMGFNDEEIVALSGAHAVGHCHADRSGFVGPWTTRPLTFSNEYFTLLTKPEGFWTPKPNTKQFQDPTGALMMLPTDLVLVQDPAFKPYVEKYAASEQVFFEDFAKVFQRLGELGWEGKLGNPV
jgi:cytochrome c peroxidase